MRENYRKQEYPDCCTVCHYGVHLRIDALEPISVLVCCYGIDVGKEDKGIEVDGMGICNRYMRRTINSKQEQYFNRIDNE